MSELRRIALMMLTPLLLSGCEGLPVLSDIGPDSGADDATVSAPTVTDRQASGTRAQEAYALRRAIELLQDGQLQQGRGELVGFLEQHPVNHTARSLLRQIDTDPAVLLGSEHTLYTVQPGDTLGELAARHLGDSVSFVALARYNGIDRPRYLQVGQTLRIPVGPGRGAAVAPAAAPPPDGDADGIEAAVPRVNEVVPGVELAAPPVGESVPGIETAAPPVDEAAAGIEAAAPPVDEVVPGIETETTPVDEVPPGIESAASPVDEVTPEVAPAAPPVGEAAAGVEPAAPPVDEVAPGIEPTESTAAEAVSPDESPIPPVDEPAAAVQSLTAPDMNAPISASAVTRVAEYHEAAVVHFRNQQLDEAIAIWDEVLALDPGFEAARAYRARALELRRRLEELGRP